MADNKWSKRFIQMALLVSSWSKDPSTGVGAVITRGKHVVSLGFNGFASGVKDTPARLEDRDYKYPLTIHAEVNAILAAKQDLTGCTLYCTHPPCASCASLIIQAGITRVICIKPCEKMAARWIKDFTLARVIFKETDIIYLEVEA